MFLTLRVPEKLEMPLREAAIRDRQRRGGGRVSMSALIIRLVAEALIREEVGAK